MAGIVFIKKTLINAYFIHTLRMYAKINYNLTGGTNRHVASVLEIYNETANDVTNGQNLQRN